MDVGLALTVCFLMASMTAVQSQIEKGPSYVQKNVGDSVTLECITVGNNCDQVDWDKVEGEGVYRGGFGMLNNDTYPPQRYSVNENGGCNLIITQLEINDSGRFICKQVVGDGEEKRRFNLEIISVQSQIQEGPANALKRAGDSVTMECVTSSNNCHQVDWAKVEGLQSPKLVYRYGQGMLNHDQYPTQRYSVNSTGGCSLTITQLVIGDSGKFMCKQDVGAGEKTRTAILVVIGVVTGSCVSNSNALDKGDGYSLWCAINVPAKSVEPSDVALALPTEAPGEINTTTNGTQLRTTLNGTATKENIMQRVCRASFTPNKQPNYDDTTASLDVCTTQQLIVSYPVENVAVFPPSGPYYKGNTVRCTADGHPPPTFKWTHLKSGDVVNGDTRVIKADARENCTCTATNTFKGKQTSQSITIEVSSTPPPPPGCESGCIVGMVICVCRVIIIVVVVYFGGWLCGFWGLSPCCIPLVNCWNNGICCVICICATKAKEKKDDRANVRLTNSTSSAPDKPPRLSENPVKPYRPRSECQYAELRPEPNPHQVNPNPVNNSTTVYAAVAIA